MAGPQHDNLNVMFSSDNGASFGGKYTSNETSTSSPALVSHNGRLFIAWKGSGNYNLNVAQVGLFATTEGDFGVESLMNKVTLVDTSPIGRALASDHGLLVLGWKGDGNDNLNVIFSSDNGASFGGTQISNETSTSSPALASHNGWLFIAWKGSGNDNLNVASIGY